MTTCIVHYHGQGPYWRNDTGSAHEGERRAYCQGVPRHQGVLLCDHHRINTAGCRCDLDEARARIDADQITRLTGGQA